MEGFTSECAPEDVVGISLPGRITARGDRGGGGWEGGYVPEERLAPSCTTPKVHPFSCCLGDAQQTPRTSNDTMFCDTTWILKWRCSCHFALKEGGLVESATNLPLNLSTTRHDEVIVDTTVPNKDLRPPLIMSGSKASSSFC